MSTNYEKVKKRWKKYFNNITERRVFEESCKGCFVERNSIRLNLKGGSIGGCESKKKAIGSDEIPVKVCEM